MVPLKRSLRSVVSVGGVRFSGTYPPEEHDTPSFVTSKRPYPDRGNLAFDTKVSICCIFGRDDLLLTRRTLVVSTFPLPLRRLGGRKKQSQRSLDHLYHPKVF